MQFDAVMEIFKRFLTHLSGKIPSHAVSIQVPTPEVTYLAIARSEGPLFLHKYFGSGWHRHGDPRTILGVTLDGFRTWVLDHGIPKFVLQEGAWGGDNHMVISEQNGVCLLVLRRGVLPRSGVSIRQ